MQFTLDQISAAHSKVKTGADFPKYIQELIGLGIISYDTFVSDGHAIYSGKDEFKITSVPKYAELAVAEKTETEEFITNLKLHQQGQTDYPRFCADAAKNGVEKWTVDLIAMTCTYYSKEGNTMLVEKIPAV